jgi:hypothetical protein
MTAPWLDSRPPTTIGLTAEERTSTKHGTTPWGIVVCGAACLAPSTTRLRGGLDEFRERDQRSIAEPAGGTPLLGALLPVDQGVETHDLRAEPLHDLPAGQQGGPGRGQVIEQGDRHARLRGGP